MEKINTGSILDTWKTIKLYNLPLVCIFICNYILQISSVIIRVQSYYTYAFIIVDGFIVVYGELRYNNNNVKKMIHFLLIGLILWFNNNIHDYMIVMLFMHIFPDMLVLLCNNLVNKYNTRLPIYSSTIIIKKPTLNIISRYAYFISRIIFKHVLVYTYVLFYNERKNNLLCILFGLCKHVLDIMDTLSVYRKLNNLNKKLE